MNNFTFGNDAGYQNYETICGGHGAGPGYDGASAVHTHMTNTLATDPEILEWRFPVVLESFAIRHGSGGAGRYRGGDGIIRRVRFLESMTAAIVSGHRRVPPYGMAGGEPGKIGHNYVERADGTIEELTGTDMAQISPGDVFVIERRVAAATARRGPAERTPVTPLRYWFQEPANDRSSCHSRDLRRWPAASG